MDYAVGDVVWADMPRTDMTGAQDRPVLLVAKVFGDDVIACMITKKHSAFDVCIPLTRGDLTEGELEHDPSFVRPVRLATLDVRIIRRRAGRVTDAFLETVLAELRKKFTR
jgi:mRNA-degrading endonuclease toxin of MazEF toxin-antitoxin module